MIRAHFPQRSKMGELPSLAMQVAYYLTVFRCGGECFRILDRLPEGDQCVARSIAKAIAADEPRSIDQQLKEWYESLPKPRSAILGVERRLQQQDSPRRFGAKMPSRSLLGPNDGRCYRGPGRVDIAWVALGGGGRLNRSGMSRLLSLH